MDTTMERWNEVTDRQREKNQQEEMCHRRKKKSTLGSRERMAKEKK